MFNQPECKQVDIEEEELPIRRLDTVGDTFNHAFCQKKKETFLFFFFSLLTAEEEDQVQEQH